MSNSVWLVELELKRIQTYLFQVPRLRAMIGANALVGETLRGKWDGRGFGKELDSLPALAWHCGAALPNGERAWPKAGFANNDDGQYDPLIGAGGHWQDDVAAVATETGVLTRDGGHFEAVFPNREKAREFLYRANELVTEQLPGARLEARLCQLERHNGLFQRNDPEKIAFACPEAIFDLAQAEICQLSGREPAGIEDVSVGTEKYHTGPSSKARWDRGVAFDKCKTYDVLGILRHKLLKAVAPSPDVRQTNEGDVFPAEFKELSTQGYLAVVHVDGNSVGKRFDKVRETFQKKDFFEEWAEKEAFFGTLRCGMRRAVLAAVEKVFAGRRNRRGKVPLRLLMLGGDDLLLVCGAPHALPFVRQLAADVREQTMELPDAMGGKAPLDIGAGVAVVQDSFPFHRAHQLAEQLATSAKRIKDLGSAVDWIVTSESWYGDIADTRQRTAVIDNTLILSCKPYPILTGDGVQGLDELLADAKKLAEDNSLARSQLARLTGSLAHGRYTAHFVAETLPNSTRLPLQKCGGLGKDDNPWTEADGRRTTRLLDLAELYELERLRQMEEGESLGQGDNSPDKEPAHA